MNRERLEKVAAVIEEHADAFDMDTWMTSEWQQDQRWRGFDVAEAVEHFDPNEHSEECDTAACIAGWACYLWSSELVKGDTFHEAGERILGLSQRQSDCLFGMSGDAYAMADELRWWALQDNDDYYGDGSGD